MELVILFGPPAVGKMAVGMELERITGLRLFHNHMTIDVVLPFFDFGDPAFHRLVGELRLAEKRPKRALERSRGNLLALEEAHRMNTDGDFFYPERWLRIDNTHLAPDVVARRIADALGLAPRASGGA